MYVNVTWVRSICQRCWSGRSFASCNDSSKKCRAFVCASRSRASSHLLGIGSIEWERVWISSVSRDTWGSESKTVGQQKLQKAALHPHHPHLSCKRCPHGSSRSTASVTRSNSKPWVIRPTPAPQSRAEENFPGSLLNASSALQGYVPTCKDMIGLCIHRSSPGCLSQKSSYWPRQLISDEKSNFNLTNLKTTNQSHTSSLKRTESSSFVNQDKSQQVYITGKAQASANHKTTLV